MTEQRCDICGELGAKPRWPRHFYLEVNKKFPKLKFDLYYNETELDFHDECLVKLIIYKLNNTNNDPTAKSSDKFFRE